MAAVSLSGTYLSTALIIGNSTGTPWVMNGSVSKVSTISTMPAAIIPCKSNGNP